MNAAAYFTFTVLFLICTVVFLGLVLVAWLGWTVGLLWAAVATPFVMFFLWRLYPYSGLGSKPGRFIGDGHGR
jgi:hypothetical protein